MGAAARGRWAGSSLRLGVEGGSGRGYAVPLRPREEGRGSSTSLLCLCECRRGCVCPALGGRRRTGAEDRRRDPLDPPGGPASIAPLSSPGPGP